ncbi:MAG: hypothetical protein HYZ50_22600, partial [Deltaproteobacteria bacterium]|nr:hypothetical protein [Deltaproteobacteria bacterium]
MHNITPHVSHLFLRRFRLGSLPGTRLGGAPAGQPPAIAIQRPDDPGLQVQQIGQQPHGLAGLLRDRDDHLAQHLGGCPAMSRAGQVAQAIREDADGLVCRSQGLRVLDQKAGAALPGRAQAVDKPRPGEQLRGEEIETKDAPVIEVNRVGLDLLRRLRGFALPLPRDGHHLGQPRRHIQMHVQPNARAPLALVGAVAHGPGDIGSYRKKRPIHRQHLPQGRGEAGLAEPRAPPRRHGVELLDHWLEHGGVSHPMEVGQGTLAQFAHRQMSLGLPGLAEVFQGPQTA